MTTATSTHYTIDNIFKSLGYIDPMVAARQQARMVLLGRQARYQAEIQLMESKWGTFAQLQQKYQQVGMEDFAADDAYLEWKWYADAAATIDAQLDTLAA